MKKRKVSKEMMRDVKGGFNPVFSVSEKDLSTRAPQELAEECSPQYIYGECTTPVYAGSACKPMPYLPYECCC